MKLCLLVENLHCTKWCVNVSYGTHWGCNMHTGTNMTMGGRAVIRFSHNHKQIARSSTEGELIGGDDALLNLLWSLEFIRAQGYDTSHAMLYQDNKSAILLEINGRLSGGKQTNHIKMIFFFVKDQVDRGEIEVKHLGTEEMWVDILAKPKQKQGKVFRNDRAMFMDCHINWQEPEAGRSDGTDVVKVKTTERGERLRSAVSLRKRTLSMWCP